MCADRGLYADWLYAAIVALRWHPFLRINQRPHKTVRVLPDGEWRLLSAVVNIGQAWSGAVECFRTHPLDGTLVARWDEGYKDPWLVLTDLPTEHANVLWYRYRTWIEDSYRDFKSDGWQWQSSRITDPKRAERHWLAMAVATLWMLTLSTQAETQQAALPKGVNPRPSRPVAQRSYSRQVSCLLLGLIVLPDEGQGAATADDAAPCPSTDAFTLIQLFLTASPQTYTCKNLGTPSFRHKISLNYC